MSARLRQRSLAHLPCQMQLDLLLDEVQVPQQVGAEAMLCTHNDLNDLRTVGQRAAKQGGHLVELVRRQLGHRQDPRKSRGTQPDLADRPWHAVDE